MSTPIRPPATRRPFSRFSRVSRAVPPAARHVLAVLVATGLWSAAALAADTTPAQQLERFAAEAGRPGDAARGRAFFNGTQGGDWSCASCHGNPPLAAGKHASTGKVVDPLAPAANPRAFTDQARVDKWLRRNCKDVAGRACSAAEKADVIAWLTSLRR